MCIFWYVPEGENSILYKKMAFDYLAERKKEGKNYDSMK